MGNYVFGVYIVDAALEYCRRTENSSCTSRRHTSPYKHATLTGAHLSQAVNLMGVYVTGVYLMGVHLMGVYLINVYLTGVHLEGVHLIDVYFMDVYMIFRYSLCACENVAEGGRPGGLFSTPFPPEPNSRVWLL